MRGYASAQTLAMTATALAFLCALTSSERVAAAQRAPDTQHEASPRQGNTWPEWAIKPVDAKLVVLAQHENAPSKLSFGIANVRIDRSASEAAARYAEALRSHGWLVEIARLDTTEATPGARPVRHCIVEGRRGAQLLRLSLVRGQPNARGSLLWARNLSGGPIGATPGAC